MSDNITHVTDADFQAEVLSSETPVLVDFWAEWCGPCKAIAPVLDEVSEERAGMLKVAKVNVDEHQALASEFGVRSIPTMLIFKDGGMQGQVVGAMNKAALIDKIDSHLAG